MLVLFKKHAIKLYQYNSIVFDLHNKDQCDGLPASQCYRERNSWLQLCAL